MSRRKKPIHATMDRLGTMEQMDKIKPLPTSKGFVVVLSGGMDSAVALRLINTALGTRAVAITFNYGQRHKIEIQYARRQCDKLGIAHSIIDLADLGNHLVSSQTPCQAQGTPIDVPEGHYTDESMKITVVPNRNMIMLSIAAGICSSLGYEHVCFAAHSGDHTIYPDCRSIFVSRLQDALDQAFEKGEAPTLYAPFIEVDKATIAFQGHQLGVLFEDTWSCYKGERGNFGEHCGVCGTCVERKEAFEVSGVPDPTLWFHEEDDEDEEDEDDDESLDYEEEDEED